MTTLADFEAAARLIAPDVPPTPQYAWPLLEAALGVKTWVKHENHTPTGAFKVRGGLVFVDRLLHEKPQTRGLVSATRGNHGQSLAFAARARGLSCVILVPHGNSVEKNAAMRAFGAEVIEFGDDFDAAKGEVPRIAAERGYEIVPSFHPDLVTGVGTYGIELFRAVPDLDVVFCPICLGSGACGLIAAKAALGRAVEIVGVVSTRADAYKRSFEGPDLVETAHPADTFADGVAVRCPSPEALAILRGGLSRIVAVDDDAVAEATRLLFSATHNLAEGAGAAALAALTGEAERWRGRRAAVILSGGNIDRGWYRTVLSGETPRVETP
ncbi:MAG: threonine dehydratase [Phyllobacteriaceae bacterium]|nr:threonine dehydratase [Phyllobacteriaceae bacterium]